MPKAMPSNRQVWNHPKSMHGTGALGLSPPVNNLETIAQQHTGEGCGDTKKCDQEEG